MSVAYRMDFSVEIPSSQSELAQPITMQDPCLSKLDDQALTSTSSESSVTCIYRALVAGALRNVAITWSNFSSCHTLAITIENLSDDDHQTCQIEFESWQVWSRKGLKSIQVDDERVDVFWDLRAVKFSATNPEPCSGYHISIVFDKQMVLLLGDLRTEAYKRTMTRPSPVAPILLHKEEILYGKNCFHTRMLLEDGPNEHDVVIENSVLRHGEPELRISIDGRMLVRVMHLNWRFRGNETVLVNNVPGANILGCV